MDTVGKIIESIQNLYSKGVASDDTALSSRLIYAKMVRVRNFLLAGQAKKKQKIGDINYSLLHAVEMEEISSSELSCVPSNCTLFKSKYPLPSPLSDLNNHLFSYVMNTERTIRYDEADFTENLYVSGNKYTKDKPRFIFENSHLYITNNSPKLLKVKYLSSDPVKTELMNNYCDEGVDCDFNVYDVVFPLESDLVRVLEQMVYQELVAVFLSVPSDEKNDNNDNRQVDGK
jgi:hypothetical protein